MCDGIRVAQSLNMEGIPYVLPPSELTDRAIQNWERSESRLVYVVIADDLELGFTETEYDLPKSKLRYRTTWTYVLLRPEKKD